MPFASASLAFYKDCYQFNPKNVFALAKTRCDAFVDFPH